MSQLNNVAGTDTLTQIETEEVIMLSPELMKEVIKGLKPLDTIVRGKGPQLAGNLTGGLIEVFDGSAAVSYYWAGGYIDISLHANGMMVICRGGA